MVSRKVDMTQKITYIGAAALAAFVVVMLGALAAYMLMGGATSSTALASQGTTDASTSGRFSSLPGQSDVPQPPQFGDSDTGSDDSGSQGNYPVTADQAANIALSSVPNATLAQQPRLVNFDGTVAYEVALSQGLVYVNAQTGQVIYNGAYGTQGRPRQRFGRPNR
jgi:uncharacterized membrane protein YkoI